MAPEDPRFAVPVPAPDSVGNGVLRAVWWQIGAIAITIPLFCICWSLVQWLALVPVYLSRKRNGYPLAAKGVLITGFVGMFLNASCAALVLFRMGQTE